MHANLKTINQESKLDIIPPFLLQTASLHHGEKKINTLSP